jgi:hypothetical protein
MADCVVKVAGTSSDRQKRAILESEGSDFWNQNSLFELDLEKVFFAPEPAAVGNFFFAISPRGRDADIARRPLLTRFGYAALALPIVQATI